MATTNQNGIRGRWLWVGGYLLLYLLASSLDLWTTILAVHTPGGSEANVYVAPDGAYALGRALLITVAGGLVMVSLFAFGSANAAHVADWWLKHPLASIAKPYLNPFSRRLIDRSPLHAVSWAIAFAVFRLLAAVNNLMIVAAGTAPIGGLIRLVDRQTSPTFGFISVVGSLYVLLTILLLPVAARLVMQMRQS